MAWLQEATEILRVLINDLSDTPTYEDNILEQTLLAAARYVVQDITLSTAYSVDFIGGSISPDPSDDDIFLNFVILKAACLTNVWQFNNKAALDGLSAKCGPAALTVKASTDIVLGLLRDGYCKTYEMLKTQNNFGNTQICKGILSPFVSNNYLPMNEGFVR